MPTVCVVVLCMVQMAGCCASQVQRRGAFRWRLLVMYSGGWRRQRMRRSAVFYTCAQRLLRPFGLGLNGQFDGVQVMIAIGAAGGQKCIGYAARGQRLVYHWLDLN